MPKLVKERKFLIKSLYRYGTYNIGKTRSGKEYKGKSKIELQKGRILTGNEIPKKFRMINKRELSSWETVQLILNTYNGIKNE